MEKDDLERRGGDALLQCNTEQQLCLCPQNPHTARPTPAHIWGVPQAFRTSLIGLTDVTRGYFEKLVGQLEKGFDDLERDYGGAGAEEAALLEVRASAASTPIQVLGVSPFGVCFR